MFYRSGTDKPRALTLTRNETAWMLPASSCRDLVAVLTKYKVKGAQRHLVVCSTYLPYDSEDTPPSKELEELVRYCETEWGSTNCSRSGETLVKFLNL